MSTRKKKKRQNEEAMRRQHSGMDGTVDERDSNPGNRRRRMERDSCQIMYGTPTCEGNLDDVFKSK